MQKKDKWHLHTLKLLGSMSFSVLLGLNVVLFRGKRQGMERPVDGHSRGKWKGGGRGRAWLLSRGENWKHSYSICYFCYTEAVLVFEISLIFFFFALVPQQTGIHFIQYKMNCNTHDFVDLYPLNHIWYSCLLITLGTAELCIMPVISNIITLSLTGKLLSQKPPEQHRKTF